MLFNTIDMHLIVHMETPRPMYMYRCFCLLIYIVCVHVCARAFMYTTNLPVLAFMNEIFGQVLF